MVPSGAGGALQLVFEEVAWESVQAPSHDHWYFCIHSRQLEIPPDIHVTKDPFTRRQHRVCAGYLKHEAQPNDPSDVWYQLDQYRQTLFECLQLNSIAAHLVGQNIEIQIRANANGNPRKSFHSLQWEQLEDKASWLHNFRANVASILVRRIVVSSFTAQICYRYTHHICNILLVVARKHIFEDELDVPRPNVIKGVILSIQEELNQKHSPRDVNLEVVRPGCFTELQNHLDEHEKRANSKPYDIVHFDMHGGVTKSGIAYLIFNQYDEKGQLQTEDVAAVHVAEELSRRNIRCTVLNGCKTGYARGGPAANLSELFVQRNQSNVLAMSYDILDTAVEQYFETFYRSFILDRREFSHSAAVARKCLRDKARRYDYNSPTLSKDVQDWFVPVVYSNDERLCIKSASVLQHVSFAWFQKPTPLRLRLRSQHFFLIAIWMMLITLLPLLEGVHIMLKFVLRVKHVNHTYRAVTGHLCGWCPLISYGSYRSYLNHSEGHDYVRTIVSQHDDRKNLLRIEGVLKHNLSGRKIFFYTRGDVTSSAEPLLRFAINTWKRTNFVNCEDWIRAEWFLQRGIIELINSDALSTQEIYSQVVQSWKHWFSLAFFELRHGLRCLFSDQCGASLAVVVQNINTLGPPGNKLDSYHRQAQKRFQKWLLRHFRSTTPARQPYLIFLGQTTERVTDQWMRERYPELTSFTSLRVTELVQPSKALAHMPETIPSRSYLHITEKSTPVTYPYHQAKALYAV